MAAGLGFAALGCVGLGLAAAFVSTGTIDTAIEQRLESWLGHDVVIDGDVSFTAFPMLAVSAERIRVGTDAATPLAEAERIDGRLAMLPLLIGRVELASATVTRPRVSLAGSEAAVLASVWRRVAETDGLGTFHIDDGRVTVGTAKGPRQIENLTFGLVANGGNEPIVGEGTFRYGGDPVEFRGTLARPARLARGRSSRIKASFTAPRFRLSFIGRTDLDPDFVFDGSFTTAAGSLREALDWMGLPAGEGAAVDAFALTGRLNVTEGVASISEAGLDLDGNHFEGAIALGYESTRPVLQATLDARHLDLGPWIARHAHAADLTSSKLLGVDGDIRVSAESLTVGETTLGSTAAAVVMRDGLVEVTLGEMNVFEGTVSGRVTLSPVEGGARMSAALRVDAIDSGQLLTRLAGEPSVTGRLNATASLAAEGGSWRDLVSKLSGDARVRLTGGTITRSLFTDDRLDDLIVAAGEAIEQASARFRITNGVAVTRDLQIDTPGVKATATGSLSLADGRLDLTGMAVTTAPPLSEAPFLLSGNWQNPILTDPPVKERTEAQNEPADTSNIVPTTAPNLAPQGSVNGGLLERIIGRF